MEPKEKRPPKPGLPDLAEFYLRLLEDAPDSLSLEKIEETTKEAERQINRGLRDGRSFEEIKDLQVIHKMVLEELKKHPELKDESHRAFKLITKAIQRRLDGPWGRLIIG